MAMALASHGSVRRADEALTMTTPIEEIRSFLEDEGNGFAAKPRETALLFARAMLAELRVSVSAWEETLRALQDSDATDSRQAP